MRLGAPLPAKFLRSVAADNDGRRLALGFTSKNLRQGQQITLGPTGVSVGGSPSQLMGWDWQRLTAGNAPIETLVVEAEAIAYETAEYSGWTSFFNRFKEVAGPVVEKILTVTDAAAMSLEYGDRFIFHGRPSDAAPDFLIDSIWALLPKEVASGSSAWHVHRGWFEDLEGHQILVNQNLDAQDGRLADGNEVRSVQIFTKTELRRSEVPLEYDMLIEKLTAMHSRSNTLFKSVLVNEMQVKVGMSGEKNEQP